VRDLVTALPRQFLEWNYFPRRKAIEESLEGRDRQDMNRFFLDSTRHNPAFCTANRRPDGSIYVNAKIVGMGYVLKREYLSAAIEALELHMRSGDEMLRRAGNAEEKASAMREYQREGLTLLSSHLYFEAEEAERRVDFTRMSTLELARDLPHSSKHTWQIVKENRSACVLYYRPPSVSFELHGTVEIVEKGDYCDFVNGVHNAFHYVPDEQRRTKWPVYLFTVEEVYDNGPGRDSFGKRIA